MATLLRTPLLPLMLRITVADAATGGFVRIPASLFGTRRFVLLPAAPHGFPQTVTMRRTAKTRTTATKTARPGDLTSPIGKHSKRMQSRIFRLMSQRRGMITTRRIQQQHCGRKPSVNSAPSNRLAWPRAYPRSSSHLSRSQRNLRSYLLAGILLAAKTTRVCPETA